MLRALGSVRAGDLEQALLVLPFSDALRLLGYLAAWLRRGTQVGALHGYQECACRAARGQRSVCLALSKRSVDGGHALISSPHAEAHACGHIRASHPWHSWVPSVGPGLLLPDVEKKVKEWRKECKGAAAGQVELVCRVAALLVRLHHAQLVATPAARAPLIALQRMLAARTQGLKDVMGFNAAALAHLQRSLKERRAGAVA